LIGGSNPLAARLFITPLSFIESFQYARFRSVTALSLPPDCKVSPERQFSPCFFKLCSLMFHLDTSGDECGASLSRDVEN
jgi:hypothetical protein